MLTPTTASERRLAARAQTKRTSPTERRGTYTDRHIQTYRCVYINIYIDIDI